MTTIAAIIIGIDNWGKYTLPLIESIQKHEPDCEIVVIDNGSKEPYPLLTDGISSRAVIIPMHRMCYSAAINWGKFTFDEWTKIRIPKPHYDWYIVLSNDVLCVGPFAHIFEQLDGNAIVGPQLWHEHGLSWIYGYCVCISKQAWIDIGPWDEGYLVSSVEDVDYSTSALEKGYALEEHDIPFEHLEQRQRFGLPEYGGTEALNWARFYAKHGRP